MNHVNGCGLLPPCLLAGWVLWLSAASCVAAEPTRASFYSLTGAAPAGFEDLTAPQRAVVDVYYGNRPIAVTMATYTLQGVAFDDPDVIVAGLPPLADPQAVRDALLGEIDSHAWKRCGRLADDDCGRLEPAAAAVIFDPDRFRADVFVNSDLVALQAPVVDRFLPAPSHGLSMLQNFTVAAAGSDRSDELLTLGAYTTIAYDHNRLISQASYTDADQLTIDRLFLQRDDRGVEYVAGVFPTSGRVPSFSGGPDIAGVRVASTLKTRTDLGIAHGTPISVSLASRARIDLLKDGRLVSSRFYEPGNQLLDTSMLPQGAFEVIVRINEAGRVREETTFYSKTSRVPPADQPLFTFELGGVLDRFQRSLLPRHTGEWVSRLGHSRRLTDTFGVDIGAVATEQDRLLEVGAFQIDALPGLPGSYYEVQAAAFTGSRQTWGLSLSTLLRTGQLYTSMNFRHVSGAEGRGADRSGYSPLPQSLSQASLTLQAPLLGGVATMTLSESRPANGPRSQARSLSYRRAMMRTALGTTELRAEFNHQDDQLLALLGVRVYLRSGNWSGEVMPAYRYDDIAPDPGGHGHQLQASSAWNNRDFAGGDLRIGASAISNGSSDSLSLSTDFDNRLARSSFAISRAGAGRQPETSWAGNLSTSLAASGAAWVVGAQNTSDAAVLVALEGESPDTEFEVLVDGYRRGYAPGNTTTLLQLPSYRSYDVAIRPRRSAFVEFDDSPRSVTLYPGSVARLHWQVDQRMVVLGRVVDGDGLPIANAFLENAYGVSSTDERGYFQAEVVVSAEQITLRFRRGGWSCAIAAPVVEMRSGVAFVHTVVCPLESAPREMITAAPPAE